MVTLLYRVKNKLLLLSVRCHHVANQASTMEFTMPHYFYFSSTALPCAKVTACVQGELDDTSQGQSQNTK